MGLKVCWANGERGEYCVNTAEFKELKLENHDAPGAVIRSRR